MTTKRKKAGKVRRNSKTGQFTTAEDVKANPDTTTTETVKRSKKKSSCDEAEANYGDGELGHPA